VGLIRVSFQPGEQTRYLEVGEGDGPAAGGLAAGQQQGAVALQAADVEAVVGGGGRSVHVAGVEHGLLGGVVKQRDAVHREPPLVRRLVEGVGQLQPDDRGTTGRMLPWTLQMSLFFKALFLSI